MNAKNVKYNSRVIGLGFGNLIVIGNKKNYVLKKAVEGFLLIFFFPAFDTLLDIDRIFFHNFVAEPGDTQRFADFGGRARAEEGIDD